MRREVTKDDYSKKQIAMAEIEAIEPGITQEELSKRIGVSIRTIYNWHNDERYMALYHQKCEKHFKSLEALAIKGLEQAVKRGRTDAMFYVLNFRGYKPADNINLSSGEININITGEDD